MCKEFLRRAVLWIVAHVGSILIYILLQQLPYLVLGPTIIPFDGSITPKAQKARNGGGGGGLEGGGGGNRSEGKEKLAVLNVG